MKAPGLLFALSMLSLGLLCVSSPRFVQRLASKAVASNVWKTGGWVKRFVDSDAYLVNVRAVGVTALLMAALVLLGLAKG